MNTPPAGRPCIAEQLACKSRAAIKQRRGNREASTREDKSVFRNHLRSHGSATPPPLLQTLIPLCELKKTKTNKNTGSCWQRLSVFCSRRLMSEMQELGKTDASDFRCAAISASPPRLQTSAGMCLWKGCK